MPFKPGHKYHAPKDGKMPGLTTHQARAKRELAAEVREHIPSSAFVDYWTLIAMGKPGVHWEEDEDGEIYATWDEDGGISPTPERVDAAVKWLADRGHGLPAQSVHLEGHLRATASVDGSALALGIVTAQAMNVIRTALLGAPASTGDSEATDAEFTEHDPEGDQPAQVIAQGGTPASQHDSSAESASASAGSRAVLDEPRRDDSSSNSSATAAPADSPARTSS